MTSQLFSILFVFISLVFSLASNSFGQLLQSKGSIADWESISDTASFSVDLTDFFEVSGVTGQLVLLDTDLGVIPLEMLPGDAPKSVTNFLKYVTDEDYDNSIFHRSSNLSFDGREPVRIIQAGGYSEAIPPLSIPADDPVELEYALANARGTVAMARTAAANTKTATSGWFINTKDNSLILGEGNAGGYAVFARVIGTGMSVADAVAALRMFNFGTNTAFSELPVEASYTVGEAVKEEDFMTISTARKVDLFPSPGGPPSFVTFSSSSTNHDIVQPSLTGSTLVLALGLNVAGSSDVKIKATDSNGNEVALEFKVTLIKPFVTIDSSEKLTLSAFESYDISVDSNVAWTVSESLDWVSVSTSQGDGPATITVDVDENAGASERVGVIDIGGQTHEIVQRGSFVAWLASHFSASEIEAMQPSSLEADPDLDGLSNAVEHALKLDPASSRSSIGTRIRSVDGDRQLVFTPYVGGLTFNLKTSSDFASWTTQASVLGTVESGSVWFDLPDDESAFYQLEVDLLSETP